MKSSLSKSKQDLTPIIGVGAGGHARVVIELLEEIGCYQVVGLLDSNPELWRTNILGVPVLGDDDLMPILVNQGMNMAFIGLAGTGDTRPRQQLYERTTASGLNVVEAVHPTALVSPSASLGSGVSVMGGSIINSQARIGVNVIVNTGVIVEHQCQVGNHVHLATGSRLCSTVTVGDGAHIGAGATVKQQIDIGEGAVVGAGAVVVENVAPFTVVAGVPARVLPSRGLETPRSSTENIARNNPQSKSSEVI